MHLQLGHIGQNKLKGAARRRFWLPHQPPNICNTCLAYTLLVEIESTFHGHHTPVRSMVAGCLKEMVAMGALRSLPEKIRVTTLFRSSKITLPNGVKPSHGVGWARMLLLMLFLIRRYTRVLFGSSSRRPNFGCSDAIAVPDIGLLQVEYYSRMVTERQNESSVC